jgi:hypothetical protein
VSHGLRSAARTPGPNTAERRFPSVGLVPYRRIRSAPTDIEIETKTMLISSGAKKGAQRTGLLQRSKNGIHFKPQTRSDPKIANRNFHFSHRPTWFPAHRRVATDVLKMFAARSIHATTLARCYSSRFSSNPSIMQTTAEKIQQILPTVLPTGGGAAAFGKKYRPRVPLANRMACCYFTQITNLTANPGSRLSAAARRMLAVRPLAAHFGSSRRANSNWTLGKRVFHGRCQRQF